MMDGMYTTATYCMSERGLKLMLMHIQLLDKQTENTQCIFNIPSRHTGFMEF